MYFPSFPLSVSEKKPEREIEKRNESVSECVMFLSCAKKKNGIYIHKCAWPMKEKHPSDVFIIVIIIIIKDTLRNLLQRKNLKPLSVVIEILTHTHIKREKAMKR